MSSIPCSCEASDSRVCYAIKWGESDGNNPRCSCGCHVPQALEPSTTLPENVTPAGPQTLKPSEPES